MPQSPLVLLPGLLCDAELWRHQIDRLRALADPLVADLTKDSSMEDMAASVLAAAPEKFALAGLSMGGYVAQAVLRLAPERVERLALLDTSFHADTDAQKTRRKDMMALAEKGDFKGVTPRLLPYLIHEGRLDDVPLTRAVMEMAERVGKQAFLRQERAILGRRNGEDVLRQVTCPTLILCGAEDALTPRRVHEEMAELVPQSRLVVVPDCGHLSTMERPEAVTAAMEGWLASL
ncbi:MAG: alpha/beta hydrolase [Alphaproteobacteria bacterium]|nr:alpha/beta hydrolase [Alphaproteobacteria bacterium]